MRHGDASPSALALHVQTACLWEATARKPGNVHRYRDFADMTYLDFALSAATLAQALAAAPDRPLGATVHEAVRLRRQVTAANTNLGIALLLGPLAKAARASDLRLGVTQVLQDADQADAAEVYRAIRLAGAGGLGEAADQDVRSEPTLPLRNVMALAADRDLIARQYANGFAEVFGLGVPALLEGFRQTNSVEEAIVLCQLRIMSRHPDSLIVRKLGRDEAEEASRRARGVVTAGWPETSTGWEALEEFDVWLRAKGHARNPGTTADLVTSCLFVTLRQGALTMTSPFSWRSRGQ